eukprot:TRINITY_DN9861_c0_g1_i1.p1 TRINITY_DN9861_c0_g1~~TRINITY_DN9861_c0_g1_i1.p1  ORF type:complete len:255 (-),score=49.35 TRINITY_DN9861_c0_g1_i1:179-862(-)
MSFLPVFNLLRDVPLVNRRMRAVLIDLQASRDIWRLAFAHQWGYNEKDLHPSRDWRRSCYLRALYERINNKDNIIHHRNDLFLDVSKNLERAIAVHDHNDNDDDNISSNNDSSNNNNKSTIFANTKKLMAFYYEKALKFIGSTYPDIDHLIDSIGHDNEEDDAKEEEKDEHDDDHDDEVVIDWSVLARLTRSIYNLDYNLTLERFNDTRFHPAGGWTHQYSSYDDGL